MRQATKQLKYKMPTLSLCIMCGEGKYRCCYRYLWGWWYSQKAERTWYDDVVLLASVQLQLCSGLLKRLKLSQSRWVSDFVKIVKFLPGEPKSIEAQVMRGEIADSVALVAWRRMKQVNKESVLWNHQMSSKSIEDIYASCWKQDEACNLKISTSNFILCRFFYYGQIKLLQKRIAWITRPSSSSHVQVNSVLLHLAMSQIGRLNG